MLSRRSQLWGAFAACLVAGASVTARASTYKELYKFQSSLAAFLPESLVRAPNGSLFGVQGADYFDPLEGEQGAGNGIFELDPPAAGQTAWKYTQIYSYTPDYPQPGQPPGFMNSQLLRDNAGNLYFGTGTGQYRSRVAAVVKLSPPASGQTAWTQTILYDHHSPTYPNIASFHLTYINSSGDLFGYDNKSNITGVGGGTVFKVRQPAAGETRGTVTILTRFGGPGDETYNYPASLLLGSDNSFYGIAYTLLNKTKVVPYIYRLTPPAAGASAWTRSTIYTYPVPTNTVAEPIGLIADRSRNLFGVDRMGGAAGQGIVYEISPPASGQTAWQRSVLYSFNRGTGFGGPEGDYPWGALTNWHGMLYGTAQHGGYLGEGEGCDFGCGTLFRLSAVTPGGTTVPWNEKTLYQFKGAPYDGAQPYGPTIPVTQADGSLTLFGLTVAGGHQNGEFGNGIIYQYTP